MELFCCGWINVFSFPQRSIDNPADEVCKGVDAFWVASSASSSRRDGEEEATDAGAGEVSRWTEGFCSKRKNGSLGWLAIRSAKRSWAISKSGSKVSALRKYSWASDMFLSEVTWASK